MLRAVVMKTSHTGRAGTALASWTVLEDTEQLRSASVFAHLYYCWPSLTNLFTQYEAFQKRLGKTFARVYQRHLWGKWSCSERHKIRREKDILNIFEFLWRYDTGYKETQIKTFLKGKVELQRYNYTDMTEFTFLKLSSNLSFIV